MRSVKPALVGSFILLLFTGGCPREQGGPAPDVADECRYTVVRPERQALRVWDGRFLDEGPRPCFGRSHCFVGGDRTRVYPLAEGSLAIEVGERRYQRPIPARLPLEIGHQRSLAHALAGDDAVALLLEGELELLTAAGAERFPLPALARGERYGPPASAYGGVGLVLVEEHKRGEAPVRPFVWLREPTSAPDGRPLHRRGEPVGRLSRAADGWRVTLDSGFTALAAPPSPTAPHVAVGDGEVFVIGDGFVRVLDSDGREGSGGPLELPLADQEHVALVGDGLFRIGPGRGVERVRATGVETVLPRASGADLAGRPLPRGAHVERLLHAGDEGARLAVVERVRLPGCRVEDRLHVVDVEARAATTLSEGGKLRLHPRFAAGKLHFVEADVRYEAVAGL